MKNVLLQFILIASLFSVISCGSSSGNLSSATTEQQLTATPSFDADCLYGYMSKYDELLSLATIQEHFKGDMSTAEMEYRKSEKPTSQNTDKYIYKWKSDRIRKMDMMGVKMDIPDQNEIGIKWLGNDLFMIKGLPTPKENFEQFYRNVSKEEAGAAMGKAAKIAQEKNGVTAEQAKTATEIGKSLGDGQQFEKVDGVGEAAAWVVKEKHLVVLVGDRTFQVIANISAEDSENKALAIALAKEILKKCN